MTDFSQLEQCSKPSSNNEQRLVTEIHLVVTVTVHLLRRQHTEILQTVIKRTITCNIKSLDIIKIKYIILISLETNSFYQE